ncbi:MAG: hypothetical protein ACOX9B_12240 [Candidatus Xenobium sp.]|jgi:hypothetical protein|nr:hypothetical protein [Burkholderiales bacterium]
MTRPSGSDGRPQERNLAREASEVLNYNQQLVQFVECRARWRIQAKAGTLILINSLFVASMGVGSVSASGPLVEMARGLTVLASAAALCLVVMSRQEAPAQARADLLFFSDIFQRPNPSHYASEFVRTLLEVQVDDMLHRTCVVARIAQRKFQTYA